MDPIKEAFQRIKEDIYYLHQEVQDLKNQISILANKQTENSQITPIPAQNQTTPTENHTVQPLYSPNTPSSIGNEGVPTDRQTNQQTNQQTQNPSQIALNEHSDEFEEANRILQSLDNIKKEIRKKFKRLTTQEMLVFSTLYTLEEQNTADITYKILAEKLSLSESSIRDYTNKLINKGIPIDKIRQNNKTITLKISQDLRKIATLNTIIQLRDL
jgi:hypothetical protein